MRKVFLSVLENEKVAKDTYVMRLVGDAGDTLYPGQFINLALDGFYLRRPFAVCDYDNKVLTIIYKTVGKGTLQMSRLGKGVMMDALTGLGNGFDQSVSGQTPLLIGGGSGIPPLYYLAKQLRADMKNVKVLLGFNSDDEIFLADDFADIGCNVTVRTIDGSFGYKGYVTDGMDMMLYSYFYACGPDRMLRAVYDKTDTDGQLSFEARMGCGFGGCMGCSCETKYGTKRICKDGPVLTKEEVIW